MQKLLGIILLILLLGCSDDPTKGPFYDTAVWSLGENDFGVLGDSTEIDTEYSIQLSSINKAVRLEASSVNSMALTSDGELYVWGDNTFGQLGFVNQSKSLIPVQILSGHFIKAMTTGGTISAAISVDGRLWMWGTLLINVVKGEVFSSSKPMVIEDLSRMKDVACGKNHCLALSENGEVWSWGSNIDGQLGDGSQIGSMIFRKVANLPFISHVAVGSDHSVVLTDNGEVYVWGSNEFGQLGIGNEHFVPDIFSDSQTKMVLEPTKVPWLENIVNVKAGYYHNLGLRNDGEVMAWGRGGSGQLGSSSFDNLWRPRKVSSISNVTLIYAYGEGSVAMTNYEEFYSWGYYNSLSKSYLGNIRRSPTHIPCFKGAIAIARGKNHYVIAKRKDGDLTTNCFLY